MLETILRAAGKKLLHTQSAIDCREKSESDFVTEVDLSVHAELGTQLASLVPGSRVISEEDAAPQAYGEGAVWIIDPVDGTSNLVYGLRHSCISAALVENGRALLGAVYNPYTTRIWTSIFPPRREKAHSSTDAPFMSAPPGAWRRRSWALKPAPLPSIVRNAC